MKDREYSIPQSDKNFVHVELWALAFNPATGERVSEPRMASFTPQQFERMKEINAFAGYEVSVISKPGDADFEEFSEERVYSQTNVDQNVEGQAIVDNRQLVDKVLAQKGENVDLDYDPDIIAAKTARTKEEVEELKKGKKK